MCDILIAKTKQKTEYQVNTWYSGFFLKKEIFMREQFVSNFITQIFHDVPDLT